MTLEIQVLVWDRHKNVVGLNRLIASQPSSLHNAIPNGNTDIHKCIMYRWILSIIDNALMFIQYINDGRCYWLHKISINKHILRVINILMYCVSLFHTSAEF